MVSYIFGQNPCCPPGAGDLQIPTPPGPNGLGRFLQHPVVTALNAGCAAWGAVGLGTPTFLGYLSPPGVRCEADVLTAPVMISAEAIAVGFFGSLFVLGVVIHETFRPRV